MLVMFDVSKTEKKRDGAETGNAHGLTEAQVALCSQLGLSQEAFAATLKETV